MYQVAHRQHPSKVKISPLLAYCGLDCATCPIYLASREADEKKRLAMRRDIARFITEHYGMSMQAEDIGDCDGCRASPGRLFATCYHCAIRQCAGQRHYRSCAACIDYPCAELVKIFDSEPGARDRLDKLRCSMSQADSQTDGK
jgi:hypothetical protein